jgi:hypothetical protein
MSIKTISLEIDAYEKLRKAKRGRESFSQVVRRAQFDPPQHSGDCIVRELAAIYQAGEGLTEKELNDLERLEQDRMQHPSLEPSPWDEDADA